RKRTFVLFGYGRQRSASAGDFAAGIGCSTLAVFITSAHKVQRIGNPDQMDSRFFVACCRSNIKRKTANSRLNLNQFAERKLNGNEQQTTPT
ncbi:hypothetical protein, partial [Enterococcus faecium]|uniref:hypothetical protein n=1 Tax=Enterococcus faecium TaxID=1352 RepID=UPI001643473F